ncbi:hypothetical protein HA402_005004 [Bradysia odoriphaga]|nr:hypothetical protein HA402_005004 [Bradysia odoriphaga]
MLCKQRLTTVLGLVLIHLLEISCAAINSTADKFPITYRNKNKVSEPGLYYNSNPTERGPISEKTFEQHPRLAFLGYFNGKNWYIERIYSNYQSAYWGCHNLGMSLAQTNKAELNFLYSVTSDAEDYSWLGARFNAVSSAFFWNDNSNPSGINLFYDSFASVALTLARNAGNTAFWVLPTTYSQYYICTI